MENKHGLMYSVEPPPIRKGGKLVWKVSFYAQFDTENKWFDKKSDALKYAKSVKPSGEMSSCHIVWYYKNNLHHLYS